MGLKVGTGDVQNVMYGNTQVKEVWVGADKVWEEDSSVPVQPFRPALVALGSSEVQVTFDDTAPNATSWVISQEQSGQGVQYTPATASPHVITAVSGSDVTVALKACNFNNDCSVFSVPATIAVI